MKLGPNALVSWGKNIAVVREPEQGLAHVVSRIDAGRGLCGAALRPEWPYTGGFIMFFDSVALGVCPACEKRLRAIVGKAGTIK